MSSATSLRAPGSGPQHIAVGSAETNRQLTDSTRLMYSADMAAFTAWCPSVGRRPLPATPETVTEYVAHLTVAPSPKTGRPLSPGPINRVLTAVRAAHRADAVPAPLRPRADAPSEDAATAPSDPKVTVTSEQFQQMFMTWLAREDAQQALWSLIVNAEVEDGGAATLAWQQELKELSPEQRTERVMEFLATNPSILEDFARQLMGSMALGLGETTLRRDRA